MSLLMLVFSVSPILAPLTGSARDRGRRLARRVLGGRSWPPFSASSCWPSRCRRRRPVQERRGEQRCRGAVGLCAAAARPCVSSVWSSSAPSALRASSRSSPTPPSSMIDHYGLTPTQYSLAFSVNAVSFIGASQFAGAARQALRAGADDALGRRRLCGGDGAAAPARSSPASTACRADGDALHRLRLPRPRHSRFGRAGARRAWPDRRHGIGADGHAAICRRHRRDGDRRSRSSTARRCR